MFRFDLPGRQEVFSRLSRKECKTVALKFKWLLPPGGLSEAQLGPTSMTSESTALGQARQFIFIPVSGRGWYCRFKQHRQRTPGVKYRVSKGSRWAWLWEGCTCQVRIFSRNRPELRSRQKWTCTAKDECAERKKKLEGVLWDQSQCGGSCVGWKGNELLCVWLRLPRVCIGQRWSIPRAANGFPGKRETGWLSSWVYLPHCSHSTQALKLC